MKQMYCMRKLLSTILFIFIVLGAKAQDDELWNSIAELKDCISVSDYTTADSICRLLGPICENNDNDSIKVCYLESKASLLFFDKEMYEESIPYLLKVIDLYEKLNIKQLNYLETFQALGMAYQLIGDAENAERYYRRALIKSVAIQAPEDFRPMIYKNLGFLYENKGDTLLANECYKRVGAEDVFDVQKLSYLEWSETMWEKVNWLRDEKRYDEAVIVLDQFIERLRFEKSADYQTVILALYSKALTMSRFLHQYSEAIPVYEAVISYSSVAKSEENICGAYCNLALCHAYNHNLDMALKVAREGERYISNASSTDFLPQSVYRFAGNGAYWAEDYDGAVPFYEKYLSEEYTRGEGKSYQEITYLLSGCYIKTNKPKLAQRVLERLLKSDEVNLREKDEITLDLVYHNLGRSLMLQNNYNTALEYFKKSANLQKKLYDNVAEITTTYITECQNRPK